MKVLTTINKRNVKLKQQISQNIKEENWRKRATYTRDNITTAAQEGPTYESGIAYKA